MNGLNNMVLEGGYPDPCLMRRKTFLGHIFIALYVDDCVCIRDKDAIAGLKEECVNSSFQVNPPGELNNYLS